MIQALTNSQYTEKFTKFQAGIENKATLPYDFLLWIILGLVIFIALGFAWVLVRHRRNKNTFIGLESITDTKRIDIILQRAVARQATCKLEIFDHRHRNIYHGKIVQAFTAYHLLMKLSQLPPANSDFDSFPAQLHLYFRPSLKEGMEHYQLSSHTLSLIVDSNAEQEAKVAVAWPKSIISSQHRIFMRVEPKRDLPLIIKVLAAPSAASPPRDPESLPSLALGSVVDLSVGGVQFMIKGKHQLPENQNLLLSIELSSSNSHMDKDSQPSRLNLILEPLSTDFISSTDPAGPPTASSQQDYTVVRGKFCGRYNFLPYAQRWEQVDFNLKNFKDLAQWIQSYQRFILQNTSPTNAIGMSKANSASPPPTNPT